MSSVYDVTLCKVGQTILPTYGVHEDYRVIGLYTVTKEFDPEVQMLAWAAITGRPVDEHGVVRGTGDDTPDNAELHFFPWLESCGFVEVPPYREIHVGQYGGTCLTEGLKTY